MVGATDECAIRTKAIRGCNNIEDRSSCLVHKNKADQDCVWCPDGLCAMKPRRVKQKCLAKKYAEKLKVFDYEDCLRTGTQNG